MLFSKALSLSEMEGIYHATYRPGTVDMPTAGAVDASKLPRSLIGFWPLDSDDNFNRATNFHGAGACVHHTGSCAELTAVNAEFVTGLFGQAFQFDGDDMLEAAADPALDLGFVTAMAWLRVRAFLSHASLAPGIVLRLLKLWCPNSPTTTPWRPTVASS